MLDFIKRLFNKQDTSSHKLLLTLKQEAQTLKLELREQEQELAILRKALEQLKSNTESELNNRLYAKQEQLLNDVAAPVAQLITQAHLLEIENKPVQARDILVVCKRLIRTLEDNGLKLKGTVGETVAFDPNYHEALSSHETFLTGENVTIRFVGISYQGKVLRKASVSKITE